jgi:hypothetical protein
MQKPSQKHKNLTSEGRRFRTSFFLRLKQILKAALMGVAASIDFLVKHGQPSHTTVPVPGRGGLGK